MKRFLHSTAVLALMIASASVLRTEALPQTSTVQTSTVQTSTVQTGASAGAAPQAMLTTYCYSCHNTRVQMGGLALQGLDVQAAGANAEIWEKAVRKLRGRLMPPPGSPQPEQKEIDSLVGWMENTLDTNPRAPKAGYVGDSADEPNRVRRGGKGAGRRRDRAKDVLPQDVAVDGFDNIASALSVSPTFVEQYVEAARMIAKKAVGDPSLDSTSYPAAAHRGVEAMPLGLRDGGMRLKHNFTADGEYRFKVHFPDQTLGLYTGSLENEATVVLMIDGKVMFKKPIGGVDDLMLNNRKAGDGRAQIADRFDKIPFRFRPAFAKWWWGSSIAPDSNPLGNQAAVAAADCRTFDNIEIKGPYKPTGVFRR